MRGANGVHAEFLQRREPPLPHAERHRRAKGAAVGVQADAIELEVFSVQPEAGVGLELEFANAKRKRFRESNDCTTGKNPTPRDTDRMFQIPNFGMIKGLMSVRSRPFPGAIVL